MIRPIVLAGLLASSLLDAQSQCRAVNTATNQPGTPSAGALATLFCTGLIGTPGTYTAPSGSPLPFILGGVEVLVNNGVAPLLAVYLPAPGSADEARIDFQVPMTRNATVTPTPDRGEIAVSAGVPAFEGFYGGRQTTVLPTNGAGHGGFFADANGYALALHAADFSLVTIDNPAHPGEVIIAYGDELFPVWPPAPIGLPTPEDVTFQYDPRLPMFYVPYQSFFLQAYPPQLGGPNVTPRLPALQVLFRGLAPDQIGIEQIQFVVPPDQPPGDWPLWAHTAPCTNRDTCGLGTASPYVKLPVRAAEPSSGAVQKPLVRSDRKRDAR